MSGDNPKLFGAPFPPMCWGGVAAAIAMAVLFLMGAW